MLRCEKLRGHSYNIYLTHFNTLIDMANKCPSMAHIRQTTSWERRTSRSQKLGKRNGAIMLLVYLFFKHIFEINFHKFPTSILGDVSLALLSIVKWFRKKNMKTSSSGLGFRDASGHRDGFLFEEPHGSGTRSRWERLPGELVGDELGMNFSWGWRIFF